jgi:hypothetical protein
LGTVVLPFWLLKRYKESQKIKTLWMYFEYKGGTINKYLSPGHMDSLVMVTLSWSAMTI